MITNKYTWQLQTRSHFVRKQRRFAKALKMWSKALQLSTAINKSINQFNVARKDEPP